MSQSKPSAKPAVHLKKQPRRETKMPDTAFLRNQEEETRVELCLHRRFVRVAHKTFLTWSPLDDVPSLWQDAGHGQRGRGD